MVADGEQALIEREKLMQDILMVMRAAAEGDFSQRTQTQAQGLFAQLTEIINTTMGKLDQVISEINRVLAIQARGGLDARIDIVTDGQLESMKQNINQSTQTLKQTICEILVSSHVVDQISDQVSKGAGDLSTRVQSQASALEEAHATLTEMTAVVQSNASNAQVADRMMHQVQGKAEEGYQVMQQTIEAVAAISESSNRIADIVTLIDGIAFQTNLLALNAAVEAARAGDHGRGFAVVAGEVRALAQKSSDAAQDIRQLIDESVVRVNTGTQLADQSGARLKEILDSISQVFSAINQISLASKEQTNAITQVNIAISDIEKATQQNAVLVEQTTAAADNMAQESTHLKQQVSFFRLGDGLSSSEPLKLGHMVSSHEL